MGTKKKLYKMSFWGLFIGLFLIGGTISLGIVSFSSSKDSNGVFAQHRPPRPPKPPTPKSPELKKPKPEKPEKPSKLEEPKKPKEPKKQKPPKPRKP
jgi:outer membrane biosynthesis protein TonB